jgi:hypothetical protein
MSNRIAHRNTGLPFSCRVSKDEGNSCSQFPLLNRQNLRWEDAGFNRPGARAQPMIREAQCVAASSTGYCYPQL